MISRLTRLFNLGVVSALLSAQMMAQDGIIISDEASPTPTNGVVLDIRSTDQGFLIPRVNEVTDITAPVEGLMAYQLQPPSGMYFYDGAAWRTWSKPVAGTVLMTGAGATIEQGEGFTVNHLGVGRDELFFDAAYPVPPVIQLASGVIAGVPPTFPSDFCDQVMGACNEVHITFLALDYPVGGTLEFNSGTTNCAPAPGNKTSYPLTDAGWAVTPPTLMAGDPMSMRFGTPANTHSVSIWGDWNQNGTFEVTELMYSESAGDVGGVLNRNAFFNIPAAACNGNTAIRVTVRGDAYDHNIGCGLDASFDGETEEIEIIVGGGSTCVYQERQTSCNVSGVLTDRFRVECTDLNGDAVDTRYYFKITENQ